MSQLLSDLEPSFRARAAAFLAFIRQFDRRFYVTSTRRTAQEQDRLYERYRRGEATYPALPAIRSKHVQGLAFDMVRLGRDPYRDPWLAGAGYIWGSEWGGSWNPSDPVHFQ